MASSSSSSKVPCATCGHKGVGIFKCEGCTQVFCRKHVIEHRDNLSHQLDEIVLEYDTLQQTIFENKTKQTDDHPLIKQINKWEQDSIEKIQKAAKEARQQVNDLPPSSKEPVSKQLHNLAERLQKAREDDDYVETDLQTWSTMIEKLKCDIDNVSSTISVHEDLTKVLVGQLYISSTSQNSVVEERFEGFCGNIRIEDNGRVALYSGSKPSFAYVQGKKEYSEGEHKIRFIMHKNNAALVMSFNIVSKCTTSQSETCAFYGWFTDDDINNPDNSYQISKDFKDFRDETSFEIELTIDCDNRKISYFNERTKNRHEIKVNINLCPFPWQLQFDLFDIGDRVQLVSSK